MILRIKRFFDRIYMLGVKFMENSETTVVNTDEIMSENIKITLHKICEDLEERGYNSIKQIVAYLISVTSHDKLILYSFLLLLISVFDRIIYYRERPVRTGKRNCMEFKINPDALKNGGSWHSPPFELDVKFRD